MRSMPNQPTLLDLRVLTLRLLLARTPRAVAGVVSVKPDALGAEVSLQEAVKKV